MTSQIRTALASGATVIMLLSAAPAGANQVTDAGYGSVEQIQYRSGNPATDPYYAPGGPAYYRVNRYGYGNYVRGPDGSYGGYPAGSAGARELEINHELKCRYTPESC